jgi:hypothetical protein
VKTPDQRDEERVQRSYVRADVQRGVRQHMTDYGPERIGRSTPKPVRLVYQRCRLRVKCAGERDLEPLRRQAGICAECALHMRATKPASMSIGEWLHSLAGKS